MFDSAKQKIERAEHHISDLEREFAAFVATKPHRFVVQSDPKSGQLLVRIRFLKAPPNNFALIIGDAIHNLRTALDHAMWEIVGIDQGMQDRYLQFPTRDNRINFEAACKGIKTPSQWVKDTIQTTEAFAGGTGADLYNLNQFDNADKHAAITPVLRGTSHPPLTITTPGGFMAMAGNVFIGGADEFTNLAVAPPGSAIELNNDAECPPSIFIKQTGGGLPLPAISMLRQFTVSVALARDVFVGADGRHLAGRTESRSSSNGGNPSQLNRTE